MISGKNPRFLFGTLFAHKAFDQKIISDRFEIFESEDMTNYHDQQLESEKYWLPIRNRDVRLVRKFQRNRAIARLFIVSCFAIGAAVGYMYCTGQLEDLDIQAKLDVVRGYLKI